MSENKLGNILIVEDDIDINGLLSKILTKEGYNVRQAFSGSEGKMCLEFFEFDIVLLDLMLPGITGEEFIEEIRKIKNTPIMVISAKTTVEDKINVLRLGADDFVTKPFDVQEVLARVEAHLRRNKIISNKKEENTTLKYKKLILEPKSREVRVNGEGLQLTSKEFKILELLVSNPKRVFTKGNLFETVWEEEFFGDDNTINVHISNLRNKIGALDSENDYIKTIWGVGFKME
ncbi:response regulator transcription factor [Clostridium sp. LIBA-8841]|uniref:response regulator transcription factor n=1 Tax=Clostridium sp. LIBA-8841 TaxID=2987530 RepID=UPI002AC4CA5E|nr:response regulator transcription factor [Clostridium sp. LIBA-8841]MDZ5253465.1 response regulator transcription factor [Clostridium sp. LIBA-8841]